MLTTTPLVQDTVVPLQAEPVPTPITEIGLQVKPKRTLTSLRSMPSKPRRAEPAAELACHSRNMSQLVCRIVVMGAYRLGAVAAGRSGIRAAAGHVGGCGSRKEGESKHGEDSEAREHLGFLSEVCWVAKGTEELIC